MTRCNACTKEPAPGHSLCPRHLAWKRGHSRARRAAIRAAGKCYDCRGVPLPGRTRCGPCALKNKVQYTLARAKRRREGVTR